jgi:CRP/FNR family transcriptional regulator
MYATLPSHADAPQTPRPVAAATVHTLPIRIRAGESAYASATHEHCLACAMRNGCVPSELRPSELRRFETALHTKRRIAPKGYLYRAGEPASSLFVIRSGFIKTSVTTEDGREQVTGFHMMGEVIGMDAIGGGKRTGDAIALEQTDMCEIPFEALRKLFPEMPSLQQKLFEMVAQELQHERELMVLLGTMRAEERLAAFLLDLGRRYGARGYSALRFLLRMSRADIGSYLGLRLETVSRLFSRFQIERLIRIDYKSIEILDATALKMVIGRALN